jgi:hypothetical protein
MSKPDVQVFTAEDFDFIGQEPHEHWQCAVARKANRLLAERGVRVYDGNSGLGAHSLGDTWSTTKYTERSGLISSNLVCSKRTALLIDVQPIKRDTAEGLLREVAELTARTRREGAASWKYDVPASLVERIARLLDAEAGEREK